METISIEILGNLAYQRVKEMILSNELMPGQKIVQDKLAMSLGISRTPLRSALQMLEAEYLVESISRKGVFVKKFSDKDIIEIYDCRIALESTAIRLFTEKASNDDIQGLTTLFSPFINKQASIEASKYQKTDVIFHETIIEKSGNQFLKKLVKQGNLLSCIDRIGLVRPPEETLQEHIQIIRAIQKRDLDLSQELCVNHLLKSKILILEKIKE